MTSPHPVASVANADGHGEVAVRIKPSAAAAWDLPGGSLVHVLDQWTECDYNGKKGFIKTKNLPGASASSVGSSLEVQDSFKANKETCMRRHAEQDNTVGNVLCYVPNGPNAVKLIENWIEIKWRGNLGFVKGRHVKLEPGKEAATAGLASMTDDDGKIAPVLSRGAPVPKVEAPASSSSVGKETPTEPPVKKLKVDEGSPAKGSGVRPKCKYGEKCYQKNPEHRKKFCHPGEPDWGGSVEAPSIATTVLSSSPPEAVEPVAEPMETGLICQGESTSKVPEKIEEPKAAEPEKIETPKAPEPEKAEVEIAPEPAPETSGSSRDCDCCFDNVQVSQGLLCPGKGHFFCAGCLSNFLVAFKTADYADQKKGKGRALCPMKDSEAPFGDGNLAAFVPQDVFDDYLQIRIKVAEKGIQEQIENEMNSKLEDLKEKLASATGAGEQLELDKHRMKIIDDIFTLKCPRCKMAFFDYDGCSAVTCGGCKCGFCSFCLEDCGKDAHQHFYKNGSKCPNEDGPLFVDHAPWQIIQNRRRENLLCKYLAAVPEDLRKKLADLVAPDAKDLGVKMPEDLTGSVLDPEAHGLIRLKLHVPHQLRVRLAKLPGFSKAGVKLKMPEAKGKVTVCSSPEKGESHVTARSVPGKPTKKNIAANLPNGHQVTIEECWIECKSKGKLGNGFVKAQNVEGRPSPGAKLKIREANGNGAAMLRKEAKPDKGKNTAGYLDNGTEVEIVQSWIECSWVGPGPGFTGFIEGGDVPEDDVFLQGSPDECWQAASEAEKALNVKLNATVFGGSGKAKGGKAKGRGRGRGR